MESKVESIRNSDGVWINTELFREAGNHFMKYGYYTPDPWGSPAWYDYWQEERRRCLHGYTVAGVTYSTNIIAEHNVEKSKLPVYILYLSIAFIFIIICFIKKYKKNSKKKI